ncbi:MAG: hypothetical protein L3J23_08815 [Flavobacteriaceae bacterium]|nr:hypothetical protein [Flavobacteriaceae bacterium]
MKKLNQILEIDNKVNRCFPIIFYNSELLELSKAKQDYENKIQFTDEYIEYYREKNYTIMPENLISKIV